METICRDVDEWDEYDRSCSEIRIVGLGGRRQSSFERSEEELGA